MFVRNFFDTIQTERAEPCSEGTEQTERGRGVDNREIINETLVHLFHEIQKLEEEAIITEDFKDLTNNDMHIIEAVGLEGGNMSSIAAKLDITVGSLTTSMNSLVKKGYTERERSEKDRRIVYIHLTGKGRQAGIPSSRKIPRADDGCRDGGTRRRGSAGARENAESADGLLSVI